MGLTDPDPYAALERAAIQSVEREDEARHLGRVVLVCGGRDYQEVERVYAVLDAELQGGRIHLLLGGARGADTLAQAWAESREMSYTVYPARWEYEGQSAGPIRNARMLAEGKPDKVIAFKGNAGTRDMVARAHRAGVPVTEIEDKETE